MSIHGLLEKYLSKLGVKDFTQLSSEERRVYDEWREILTKEPNVEDLAKFIEYQQKELNNELRKAVQKGKSRKAILITARLENYDPMLGVLKATEQNKEALAKHITSLLSKE